MITRLYQTVKINPLTDAVTQRQIGGDELVGLVQQIGTSVSGGILMGRTLVDMEGYLVTSISMGRTKL